MRYRAVWNYFGCNDLVLLVTLVFTCAILCTITLRFSHLVWLSVWLIDWSEPEIDFTLLFYQSYILKKPSIWSQRVYLRPWELTVLISPACHQYSCPEGLTLQSYLQKCDEEEEGVGCSSELRVQEPRQERKNVVLRSAVWEKEKTRGNEKGGYIPTMTTI